MPLFFISSLEGHSITDGTDEQKLC